MLDFSNYITEKWVADLSKKDSVYPIFENPSSKDLVELQKNLNNSKVVRFFAILKTKKVYVWDGMMFIHSVALSLLKGKKIVPNTLVLEDLSQALAGECKIAEGKLFFSANENDSYFGPMIRSAIKGKKDDSFLLAPYFDWEDLIEDLPEIIKKYNWVDKYIKGISETSGPAILLKYTKEKQ